MVDEFYTSEDKVLQRLNVSHAHALAALKEAGYLDLGQARDILGKQLPYHAVLLVKIAALKRSLIELQRPELTIELGREAKKGK
jgi:hypothetical protein